MGRFSSHLVSEQCGYRHHWLSIWYLLNLFFFLSFFISLYNSNFFSEKKISNHFEKSQKSRAAHSKDFDIKLFQSTVSNLLIIVWLFIYCFFGHLISSKCAQVGDIAYQSRFYEYPTDFKMYTLFIIARSQRPFFITGYKLTKCSLETYTNVSVFRMNILKPMNCVKLTPLFRTYINTCFFETSTCKI